MGTRPTASDVSAITLLEWESLFRRPQLPAWLIETLRSTACHCTSALVYDSANAEAVIALVSGGVRWELLAFRTYVVELALKCLMIVEQLQLAQHAHRQLLKCGEHCRINLSRPIQSKRLLPKRHSEQKIGIGKRSPAVPATPPCVRVRTRRFGELS